MTERAHAPRAAASLPVQLLAMTFARLCINTALRMVYPFAPELSRGLGVDLPAVYRLITIRNVAGLLSPLFSPLSEHHGRKRVMIGAVGLFVASCLLVVVWPAYWPLGLALVLIAVAKVIFDPAMQAFVGETVAYARRGRAIAVTEYSWALALLLGGPLVGVAIARGGWLAPFRWLALLAAVAALLLALFLPRTGRRMTTAVTLSAIPGLLRRYPVMLAVTAYVGLQMCANELVLIVYGDWMETSFNLSLASLGLTAAVIGGAELCGETVAGLAVDRFGKRPIVITTGLLTAVFYAFIPYSGGNLTAALVTLFLLFLVFEITVVGSVPLLTEVVPEARSVVMALALGGGSLGRALGAWTGPAVWARGGLGLTGLAAALVMITAVGVLLRWVREGDRDGR